MASLSWLRFGAKKPQCKSCMHCFVCMCVDMLLINCNIKSLTGYCQLLRFPLLLKLRTYTDTDPPATHTHIRLYVYIYIFNERCLFYALVFLFIIYHCCTLILYTLKYAHTHTSAITTSYFCCVSIPFLTSSNYYLLLSVLLPLLC